MRLEPLVTVSRPAGVPWRRSVDPAVIKLLLQRGQGGENGHKHENRTVMECYYLTQPGKIGYKERMDAICNQRGMFSATEQRLVDQANQIKKRKWLSDLELEEIKRTIHDADHGQVTEDTSDREKYDVNLEILDSEEEAGSQNVEPRAF